MGRVIGDGGCFFQVTDIAVKPSFQGRGLGKKPSWGKSAHS
ncbi:hypothetical protein ACFTAO_51075 [Paenibacillus rhizoplanae]